mgnify:CR=1 FL=1
MTNFRSQEARFVAWLLRGLHRQTCRLARRARHQRQREMLLLNHPLSRDNPETECLDLVPSSVDVYEQAEDRMLLQAFHSCMSELTLLQQKVVQAVLLEGVTEQEMARELGISQQSVNRIKRRAINRLKGCMEEWVNGTRT